MLPVAAILIAAVWLWGANLFLWRRLRFDPHPLAVFQLEDARAHLTHARVWGVARASSLLYLASLAAFLRLASLDTVTQFCRSGWTLLTE